MLTLTKRFYPAGVGARDLRECLLLQLQRQGKRRRSETKIVSSTWKIWAGRRFPESHVRMGISVETCKRPVTTCRLNPPLQISCSALAGDSTASAVNPNESLQKRTATRRIELCGTSRSRLKYHERQFCTVWPDPAI